MAAHSIASTAFCWWRRAYTSTSNTSSSHERRRSGWRYCRVKAFCAALAAAARLVAHANAGLLAIAFAIFLGSMLIVAFRWRQILAALGCRATVWDTLLTYSAGLCIGNVTPTRILGADAFRLAVIRSRTGATVRIVAASIFYDRISEAPAITILALLTLSRFRTYM